MKKEKAIDNTTFTMNVNGVQYTVWNGTWIEEGVCVRNDETQAYVIVKSEGTYANKSSVRKAILKHADELAIPRVEETADQEVMTEDEAEMEQSTEVDHEDEEVQNKDINSNYVNQWCIGLLPKYVKDKIVHCSFDENPRFYRIAYMVNGERRVIQERLWKNVVNELKRECRKAQ